MAAARALRAPHRPQPRWSLRRGAAAREPRQTAGVEAFARQAPASGVPQPRPGKPRIAIARVVRVADSAALSVAISRALETCSSGRTRKISRTPSSGSGATCAMPVEPENAATASHPKQHGLGLVVERVRGEDMGEACAGGGLRQQLVARVARRFLQSAARFLAAPVQSAMRQRRGCARAVSRRRFARRFRPQAVIDGDGEKFRRAL